MTREIYNNRWENYRTSMKVESVIYNVPEKRRRDIT